MRRVIEFSNVDVTPTFEEVLEVQGMGGRTNIPARIRELADTALGHFKQLAVPKGLMSNLPVSDFEAVYDGEGRNSPENPVRFIYPKADALALFAVTLGNPLTEKARELFANGGPALGFMLDTVTTAGAERLGNLMSRQFGNYLSEKNSVCRNCTVYHYSPGNCGWHLSSQGKIFQFLHPEEIGMSISSGFHMRPLKSLTGVLIAGPKEIHQYKPDFPTCLQCKTHKCAQRLAHLQRADQAAASGSGSLS